MNIQLKWIYRLCLLLLLFIIIFLIWKIKSIWLPVLISVKKILMPFIAAGFITYLLNPLIVALSKYRLKRSGAAILIFGLFFSLVSYSLYKGIPLFIKELEEFSKNIPHFSAQFSLWIENLETETSSWPISIAEKILNNIDHVQLSVDNYLASLATRLPEIINFTILIALIPFIAFYMIKDYDLLKKSAWYITPRQWRKQGINFLKDVDKSLGGYIRGQLILSLLVALLTIISFALIGMKYSLLLGIIVGITNIIPYFGPFFGLIPALIVASTISVKMIVFVILIIFTIQFIEGSILSPLIVGKTLEMHPLVIILALLIGGELGGLIGLVLIVPVVAIGKEALINARKYWPILKNKQIGEKD